MISFYAVCFCVILYFLNKDSRQKRFYEIRIQQVEEDINILKDSIAKVRANNNSLLERIERYHNLKDILIKLNQRLELSNIAETIVSISFSLISNNKGVCLLYLADKKEKVKLSLLKTRREQEGLIIKAKEGDIFDLWVLRHASPLLVEDSKKDFRFDPEKLTSKNFRPLASLISSPLISEEHFLGILRLDNTSPNFYSQDDLRLLVTLSDSAAVALENGQLFEKTQELAITDGLTHFYRKEYFLSRLSQECARALRNNEVFSMLVVDIDYFKNYNDRLGHTAGDIVLKSLSQTMAEALAEYNPFICRFGGEEFCVLLPLADKAKAHAIAESLRALVEARKIIIRRQESTITVSIGVATFLADARDEKEFIMKADKAMYRAKNSGRNKVVDA